MVPSHVQVFASPMPSSGELSRTATPAERVRLVVALSETGGTLCYIGVSLDVRGKRCGRRATYSFWLGTREGNVSNWSRILESSEQHTS
jgi:hypothetical protein